MIEILLFKDLSVADQQNIGQFISFQLSETYEQLIQFPSQIFLTSLTILLTARLRLTQERIRNLILEEDNGSIGFILNKGKSSFFVLFLSGHAVISFQLFEIPRQSPTNEQIINALRNLIDKRILNLIDPNRCPLHAICGSLVVGKFTREDCLELIKMIIGPKGELVNVKLFSLPNGDYLGEFTPKKIGREKETNSIDQSMFSFRSISN